MEGRAFCNFKGQGVGWGGGGGARKVFLPPVVDIFSGITNLAEMFYKVNIHFRVFTLR